MADLIFSSLMVVRGITMDIQAVPMPRQEMVKNGSDKVHAPEMGLSKVADLIIQETYV